MLIVSSDEGAAGAIPWRPELKQLTVGLSAVAALFGAHTINMAAITAAICLGDDVHPDKRKKWMVGIAYAFFWVCLGIFGPEILAGLAALPPALMATVAGLALINPLIGALASAFGPANDRFAAATTLVVAASGITAFGIGGAFWGLVAGLVVHIAELALRGRT